MRKRIVYIIISILSVLLSITIYFTIYNRKSQQIQFETQKATYQHILRTVIATGTLQALQTVEVGTQVSGVIDSIFVDFNTVVEKGQLLAEMDKTPLLANLEDAQASYDNAEADVEYHKTTFNRICTLFEKDMTSKSDYDLALYNLKKADAGLRTANARLEKAKVDLSYASIYSPIKGVVLHRAVDQGQTVAANFNAPTLFSIANDLTQMQIEADVDEADIGQVKEGQRVEFNVDAYPNDIFQGTIRQIRLQPETKSNVTTYTVIINATNPNKILMPGMTANISIVVEENTRGLVVPSRTLFFRPDERYASIIHLGRNEDNSPVPNPRIGNNSNNGNKPQNIKMTDRVWVKRGDTIQQVIVSTGIEDGQHTEITQGLKENDEVIISIRSNPKGRIKHTEASNPFMPKPPGQRR